MERAAISVSSSSRYGGLPRQGLCPCIIAPSANAVATSARGSSSSSCPITGLLTSEGGHEAAAGRKVNYSRYNGSWVKTGRRFDGCKVKGIGAGGASSHSFHKGYISIRAADTNAEGKTKVEDAPPTREGNGSAMNQMLGIKGASAETDVWKIRLQLTKPVTWAPLIWGVACGAAASGNFEWGNPQDVAKAALCMFMSGPLLTGYTQTMNDWYDREIDAINEPYRPIPSGAISESQVIAQIWVLLLGGIGASYLLDVWAGHDFPVILSLALGGSLLSYIYSAPPLKLKQSGWIGNYALGSSYISLPWWSGQALFGTLTPDVIVLTLLYSTAGLGIAIINDFKSIDGDRAMGLQSLPVAFGVDTAKWICAGTIDITQLSVAGYLFAQGKTTFGLILLALIAPQILFQFQYFLKDPIKNDVKYQASAQPFFVFGLLATALATSH